jgi:hypothetical protein
MSAHMAAVGMLLTACQAPLSLSSTSPAAGFGGDSQFCNLKRQQWDAWNDPRIAKDSVWLARLAELNDQAAAVAPAEIRQDAQIVAAEYHRAARLAAGESTNQSDATDLLNPELLAAGKHLHAYTESTCGIVLPE